MSECARCGVIFAKAAPALPEPRTAAMLATAGGGTMYDPLVHAAALAAQRAGERARAEQQLAARDRQERRVRAAALPAALLLGWMAVQLAPAPIRFLSMWVHESGHAVAAWLSGYMAFPGPWVTPVGSERNPLVTIVVAGWLAFGLHRAWTSGRRGWSAAALTVLGLTAYCTVALTDTQAEQLVLFAGDGGCFVLGSLLMLTIYAAPDHAIRRDGACWGLLGLGSLAFMDALRVWTGPFESLPFGEATNGVSDSSMLNEMYGWSIPLIVSRYRLLAAVAFAGLAAVYVAGLWRGAHAAEARPDASQA